MTRRLFADPELPNKLRAGRYEDIAPCTACDTCLDAWVVKRHCRINAALGTEHYVIDKAVKKKKVMVVGGGPAGMEAARVAALRGHEVTLYEGSRKLGGLLPLASLVKGLEIEDLPAIVRYLRRQIKELGVAVHLGEEVTPELVEKVKPDVVFIATGGVPEQPKIPGIERPIVKSNAQLHKHAEAILEVFRAEASEVAHEVLDAFGQKDRRRGRRHTRVRNGRVPGKTGQKGYYSGSNGCIGGRDGDEGEAPSFSVVRQKGRESFHRGRHR